MAVFLGGLFLFVYRFFYGGEVTFVQSLAIVVWSALAIAIVSIPLLVVVFFGKGDWNLNPQSVVQANLSLLLERSRLFNGIDFGGMVRRTGRNLHQPVGDGGRSVGRRLRIACRDGFCERR